MARREIGDVHASGRHPDPCRWDRALPRTFLDGIAPVPAIDPDVRARIRETPVEENHAKLETLDPHPRRGSIAPTPRASTAPSRSSSRPAGPSPNGSRNGAAESLARWRLDRSSSCPPRKWLYARCDDRFARMIDAGAVAEVEALLARNLNPGLPAMRAIGVRELLAYLRGDPRSTTPSPRASKRPAATPSASTPGSLTSRRRIGRVSSRRWTSMRSLMRWPDTD